MSQERPENEQPDPDEEEEYDDDLEDTEDATVIRQVPLAWALSSVPWIVVAIALYFLIGFDEITILLIVLVVAVPRYVAQRRTHYTITYRSLIYQRGGIFGVQRVPIPIDRLKDVRTKFGLFGKTLGYKTVDVMLDNGAVADLSYVPIYLDIEGQLRELIDEAAEDDDDYLDDDDEVEDEGDDDDGDGDRGQAERPLSGGEAAFKLVRAAKLIDGISDKPVAGGAVLLRGAKVAAVGPQAAEAAPEGARVEVFDYPDATVMPGMVDCHTHHNGFGDGRLGDDLATLPDEVLTLQSARNARVSLFSGVTSIRENGPKNATMFRLRDAIDDGREIGPRMVLCGRPVATIGGHMGYMGSEVTGPHPARAMVRQLIKEGAGLYQDHRHRRQHEDFLPPSPVVQPRRADGHRGRGAQVRQADSRPLHLHPGDRQLPRRRRRHDHPLRIQGARRLLQLPRGRGRAHRGAGRVRQPHDTRLQVHRLESPPAAGAAQA